MIPVQQFLIEECRNIGSQLNDSLRHSYGQEGSKEFYGECRTRLESSLGVLNSLKPDDNDALEAICHQLTNLSGLISRIERSAQSEFSWAFGEELRGLAGRLCAENTLANPAQEPKIHMFAEGGLDQYAIYPEQNRPTSALRRILTIVFPTTLKHTILLHPILGHEVGHALFAIPKHQKALAGLLLSTLASAGPMASSKNATDWLWGTASPAGFKQFIKNRGINQFALTNRSLVSWIEEFLCDFIGLILFGPSFVAAQQSLLLAMGPDGWVFGANHPPVVCRINAMLTAVEHLGWSNSPGHSADVQQAVDGFWADAFGKRSQDPWCEVFTKKQIGDLVDGLVALIAFCPGAAYTPMPIPTTEKMVGLLQRGVPPMGGAVQPDGTISLSAIDFRHILHAGWLTTKTADYIPENFLSVNRLCELGILQQRAIDRVSAFPA